MRRVTLSLSALALAGVALMTMTTSAAAQERGSKKEARQATRVFFQSHMRLAEHHMMSGRYAEALKHFTAVIDKEIKLPTRPEQADEMMGDDEVFAEEKPERRRQRGKRGKRGKLLKVKLKAHMGAAAASWRLGEKDQAEGYAAAGIALAEKANAKRGVKMFERFLEDPDKVVDRVAPTAKDLEERLRRAEGILK